ncbi:MAG: hypothetical protein KGK05_06110 [Xanthomonadaceae bacterium]|nr:hypothetical protein [Xanthomonadaceae bacterium]
MTTPSERTRNILQAGAYLKELRADRSLPERVRNEANRLLRHYPTVSDVQMLAMIEAKFMGSNLLTPQFDRGWCGSYPLGPHTD